MPNPAELTLDTWTGLSHKPVIGHAAGGTTTGVAPSWADPHRRRLNAYHLLWGYRRNAARYFLPGGGVDDLGGWAKRREYGDAELLVQSIRAAILGGQPRVQVDDADGEPPEEPGPDATPAELAAWQAEAEAVQAAVERQAWFDAWADTEHVARTVVACESNAVGLGDGVYVLGWAPERGRVTLRSMDPGFYFPVLDDDTDGFPTKVHLAWDKTTARGEREAVRRITYELVPCPPRRYPYAPDTVSEVECVLTDATWQYDELGATGVADLAESYGRPREDAQGQVWRRPLGIDFIPVVHVPHTPPEADDAPWGEAALVRVAQVLDDLHAADTDLAHTAELVGSPPLSVKDGPARQLTSYGPGTMLPGDVTLLDTSRSLVALAEWRNSLLTRLSENRQLPDAVLGRGTNQAGESGLHLLLRYGPFATYIEDCRLVRAEKYALLCKLVQRMAVAAGKAAEAAGQPLPAGALPGNAPVLPARLALGAYVPADQAAEVDRVQRLHAAKLLSRATALRMLQAAGVPIDSIDDELDAIQAEDFDGARELADATNNDALAVQYLGLDTDTDTGPPGLPQ